MFLLAGQSNMAGHGCIREDDPWQHEDFAAVPGVWVLGGQARAKSARPCGWIRWRPAAHPLHLNQRSSAFGLGLEFARVYQQLRPGAGVGLVPCAWGGAGIECFARGQPLRENLVRRACFAARSGVLHGVLWHQGETDTMDEVLARTHEGKLRALIQEVREETGTPDLLFAVGDLSPAMAEAKQASDPPWATRIEVVRAGLRRVAQGDPRCVWVSSDQLPGSTRDVFHFDRASLVELGRRYAVALTGCSSATE